MCLAANSYALYRNLVNANHVIFVSPLQTSRTAKYDALMRQSAGRALRLMQTRKVYIYMCVVLNTVDVDILEMRTSCRMLRRPAVHGDNAATARPRRTDESDDEEMQDASGATSMPQGTKRKRNAAEIDDSDNASAKRTRNARSLDRPTEEIDLEMDDDDEAVARQLQFEMQANDAAIAEQMQSEEYQLSTGNHSEDGQGHPAANSGSRNLRWELKPTALLDEDEQKQMWGTGFEKAPDEHEFE